MDTGFHLIHALRKHSKLRTDFVACSSGTVLIRRKKYLAGLLHMRDRDRDKGASFTSKDNSKDSSNAKEELVLTQSPGQANLFGLTPFDHSILMAPFLLL